MAGNDTENRPYGQITASDWVTSGGEVPGLDIIISRVLMIVNQCVVQDECETDMTETATPSLLHFISFPTLCSPLISFPSFPSSLPFSPFLSFPLLFPPFLFLSFYFRSPLFYLPFLCSPLLFTFPFLSSPFLFLSFPLLSSPVQLSHY